VTDKSRAPSVLPSNKAVVPAARPLFFYINAKSLEKPFVKDFLNFFLNDTDAYINKLNYMPLSEIASRARTPSWRTS
jgi:phosphate transport system substrate-binding protein